jgi:hypothetical protein
MAVTVDIPDLGPVQINGAAEEATMKAILAELKRGGGGAGNNAGGGAGGGIGGTVGSVLKLGKTINPLAKGFGLITGTLGTLGRTTQRLAQGFADTVDVFAKGRPSVTDFSTTLANMVPGVLKPFANAINSIIKLLYGNYTTFQDLTKTGIALGDKIGSLQSDFTALGLQSKEIGSALGAQSDGLASLGTATRGANVALSMLKNITEEESKQLQTYGISIAEQAEALAEYAGQNALGLRMRTTDEAQLLKLSVDYQKNLRRLSEITGQQAEDIAQGMAKANMNENFRSFLSGLDGATRARMESIINTAEAGFGDAGREAAMAAILGVGPVTDQAAMLSSTMQGFNSTIQSSVTSARSFNGTQSDYNKMLIGNFRGLANANAGFIQRTSQMGAVLGMTGDATGQTFSEIARFGRIFGGTLEETESNLGNLDAAGNAMINTEQAIARFRSQLMNIVGLIGETMAPALEDFAKYLNGPGIKAIEDFVGRLKTDLNPFTEEGRANILAGLMDLIRNIGKALSDAIRGGGSATLGNVATGDTISSGFITGALGIGAGIDKDSFRNQAGATGTGRGGLMGLIDNSSFGIDGYLASVYKELEGQYAGKPKEAKKALLDAIEQYINSNYQGGDLDVMKKFLEGTITSKVNALPEFNKGTLGMGSLFQNFGKGTPAMLHGEEAVVPKNSPMGGILNMMQGAMGDMKGSMKNGKMDIGSMIQTAQTHGAKIDAYAQENAGAIKNQGRGMVKNMTGLSDEQLDKMEAESVKSKQKSSSSTSVNNFNNGTGAKLDKLISVNTQMLDELRNM